MEPLAFGATQGSVRSAELQFRGSAIHVLQHAAGSARVSDPAGALTARSPAIPETCGPESGSVGDRPQQSYFLRAESRRGAACHTGLPDPPFSRRTLFGTAGLAAASWLTPVAEILAQAAEDAKERQPARSIIVLWLAGGPSQLETFDPHPGKSISGGTRAIKTAAPGIELAEGLEKLAEQMEHVSLVRSLVSKEGDHERGTYAIKTGYVPDPTAVHPSLGAICCHELPEALPGGLRAELPRHISIFPGAWPARGGFLGDQFDAFKTYDPAHGVPDVKSPLSAEQYQKRMENLAVIERAFARGRRKQVEATLHRDTLARAHTMMNTPQLAAFDISQEPAELRAAYGDTPFGRGCLAARRLIEVGVRCVEVTLEGWDTHAKNHESVRERLKILDPAFAALLADLRRRGLLEHTIVLCAGEFGRTPQVNRLAGRDHWPHGFSVALAGGGLRGGHVVGATDPEGGKQVENPKKIGDVYATLLTALGLDPGKENIAPSLRPIKLAEGDPIGELLL
jgi:uncharacterized protein (DUF1501 family)